VVQFCDGFLGKQKSGNAWGISEKPISHWENVTRNWGGDTGSDCIGTIQSTMELPRHQLSFYLKPPQLTNTINPWQNGQ